MYSKISSPKEVPHLAQTLKPVKHWMNAHRLNLTHAKTEFLLITSSQSALPAQSWIDSLVHRITSGALYSSIPSYGSYSSLHNSRHPYNVHSGIPGIEVEKSLAGSDPLLVPIHGF